MLSWLLSASPERKRALLAASLGWMLDGMDVMLYAMVLPSLMAELGLSTRTGGLLASLTLVASAAGGLVFGVLADRFGRTRALMASMMMYSVFTAACGVARSVTELAVFRVLLGLGMGGEWASGAALVAETWPAVHRGKAIGVMQSCWAIGYGLAAAVTALVLPRFGWRAVFFVGIAPALVTLWVRRRVTEPEVWRQARARKPRVSFAVLLSPGILGPALVVTLVNACSMFAWWGMFTWIPSYLGASAAHGGAGLDIVRTSTWVIVMQVGMWFGYVSFGAVSDHLGRRSAYVGYLAVAACLVPAFAAARSPLALLLLGPPLAFFGTGYFVGFGVLTAELFPTSVRASAQGFTYNIGRIASAVAPFAVGAVASTHGLGAAFDIVAVAFAVAALAALALPETRGREILPD
jgi:MFS family permease